MLFTNTNLRTAMAYTNAVGDKVYPIIVDIKKGIKSTEEVSFVSSDINTGILSVAFIQGNDTYNVEGAEVICSIMRPDTTTLEIPCDIINGNIVEVPLGVNGTSQDGVYSFDFKVFKGGNKIVGTPIMNYSVSLSISNDLVVEEDDRLPVLTMLITQVNELKEETRETINQANVATVASKEATANAIEATNNANAVSERVSQETATAISEIKQDTANAIDTMNQSTSTAISTMNQSTTNAIDSMNQNTTNAIASMTQKTDEALANMNQSTTDAVINMTQKTDEAVTTINDNLANVNNVVTTKVAELDNAKSDMTTTVSNKIDEVETRFNALTSSQQQDAEVIDARDGETSLKARLDRDIEKAKQVYVDVEGSNISTDSSVGYAKDVEILGNTIQDASNLADIRSVGDTVEGQELYEIPVVSCGKNLFNPYRCVNPYFTLKNGMYSGNTSSYHVSLLQNGNGSNGDRDVSKLMKIKKGNYFITFKSNTSSVISVASYDKDGKCIAHLGEFSQIKGISLDKDCYLDIRIANKGAFEVFDIQIEEGTVSTPYEPYQEDKLTILSPVQLEKVGDVRDRIVCKDGVWGVEKNVVDLILNGSEKWVTGKIGTNTILFRINKSLDTLYSDNVYYINTLAKSVRGSDSWNNDIECVAITIDKYIDVRILKSRLTTEDIDGFKDYLKNNPVTIKYPLTTPQFIPLPHDQQIKLRTFANKTNISFGCEIEGTIKAQVPKSLGATVNTHTEQISNLNKELDRVKKLEESTVSTVTTESDFTTVEATSNGYFEDVKLEGKTLVNLCPLALEHSVGSDTVAYSRRKTFDKQLDLNKEYTLAILNAPTSKIRTIASNGYLFNEIAYKSIIKFKPLKNDSFTIYFYGTGFTDSDFANTKYVLLEGDHTQNPPSYFEGLKSVGQSASEDGVDEIVVSSVNKNLFSNQYENTAYYVDSTGEKVAIPLGKQYRTSIKVAPNTTYTSTCVQKINSHIRYCEYDKNGNFIQRNLHTVSNSTPYTFTTSPNTSYIDVYYEVDLLGLAQLERGTQTIEYTPHQSDKKRLLYYNNETQTWEKPILREWDSIEKHADGKYYYHVNTRYKRVTANDVTALVLSNDSSLIRVSILNTSNPKPPSVKKPTLVCGQLQTKDRDELYNFNAGEGVSQFSGTGQPFMVLSASKVGGTTLDKVKEYVTNNVIDFIVPTNSEEVYECTNIDLITYANETNYIVESGAIAPKSILKVHNNISNVVKILQEKVSLLENKFIEGLKKVLAGDMYSLAELLYPEDFVEENPENNIMLLPFE